MYTSAQLSKLILLTRKKYEKKGIYASKRLLAYLSGVSYEKITHIDRYKPYIDIAYKKIEKHFRSI